MKDDASNLHNARVLRNGRTIKQLFTLFQILSDRPAPRWAGLGLGRAPVVQRCCNPTCGRLATLRNGTAIDCGDATVSDPFGGGVFRMCGYRYY